MKKILIILLLLCIGMAACGKQQVLSPNAVPEGTQAAQSSENLKLQLENELAELETQEQALYDEMNAKEFITQMDMNLTSAEALQLWDDKLNEIWALLEGTMPEADFTALKSEQRDWIADKESKLSEIKKAETGSAAPTIVNSAALDMTKERVYFLVSYLG